jgi:hypothetical protein
MSEYMPPMGGSDIMLNGLLKHVDVDAYNVNIISSRCQEDLIKDDPGVDFQGLEGELDPIQQ